MGRRRDNPDDIKVLLEEDEARGQVGNYKDHIQLLILAELKTLNTRLADIAAAITANGAGGTALNR